MVTIGKLSKRTGCNIETIRYYERIGILLKPQRTEGGHRLYNQEQIKRLVFVRRSRELGFSLEGIRNLLRLVDGKKTTCQEIKTVTEGHLQDIKKKIADLKCLKKLSMIFHLNAGEGLFLIVQLSIPFSQKMIVSPQSFMDQRG